MHDCAVLFLKRTQCVHRSAAKPNLDAPANQLALPWKMPKRAQ